VNELGAFRWAIRGALALAPAVVVGVFAGTWEAVVVAIAGVAAVAAWTQLRRRPSPRITGAPPRLGPPDERRLLVVAGDALGDERLPDVVANAVAGGPAHVFLLAPVEVSATAHWTNATDGAHAEAARLARDAAAALQGIPVETAVVDDEPLQAVEDALRSFGPDEILVVTRGERSELARRARERFAVPVGHTVLS
jgi:hypothetical protein